MSANKAKKISSQMPMIFDFIDYRDYLKKYYEAEKKTNPNFSYKLFAMRAGFSAASQLLLVIQGKRNITGRSMAKFIRGLKLNEREQKYFENLVHFNQADDNETKIFYFERLRYITGNAKRHKLNQNEYEYLSKWYIPAIRELVGHSDFRPDPAWIANKLRNKITPMQAKRSIRLLLELGLIRQNENNKLIQTNINIVTPDMISDIASYEFQRQVIDLAKESLDSKKSESWKKMASLTASLSNTKRKKIMNHLKDFKDKVLSELESSDDDPKEIYQLNFQLFSVSKLAGGTNENI